jgi:hypothetical protein
MPPGQHVSIVDVRLTDQGLLAGVDGAGPRTLGTFVKRTDISSRLKGAT